MTSRRGSGVDLKRQGLLADEVPVPDEIEVAVRTAFAERLDRVIGARQRLLARRLAPAYR